MMSHRFLAYKAGDKRFYPGEVDLSKPSADGLVRVNPGLPRWAPHVRFRRVQTLVREGSPLVKLRNSA
jgi:hypothetical protein